MASTPLLEAASSSMHVERRARAAIARHDSQTPQGSPSCEVLAVERLGEDAGRRGLAGAPGAAEQVGVADPAVAHGVAQRPGDVVLAPHLARTAAAGSGGRATGTQLVRHGDESTRATMQRVPRAVRRGPTRSATR